MAPSSSRSRSKKRKTAPLQEEEKPMGEDFVIDCSGDRLEIKGEDADFLLKNCEYFEHVFAHGTKESTTRVLPKPDWDIDTARNLVKLILTQNFEYKDEHDRDTFLKLREAADQILLQYTILHPVSEREIQGDERLIRLMVDAFKNADGRCFKLKNCNLVPPKFESESDSDIDESESEEEEEQQEEQNRVKKKEHWWNQFLNQGILMIDRYVSFSMHVATAEEMKEFDVRDKSKPQKNFLSYYSTPLYIAVIHTCSALMQARGYSERETNDTFSVKFQIYCGFYKCCQDLTDDIDVEWDVEFNSSGLADDVEVTGSIAELCAILVHVEPYVVPSQGVKKCAAFFKDPSLEAIGRLIYACQQCEDNPSSLLWDCAKNTFFTLKTLDDTKVILNALMEEKGELAQDGPFELTEKQVSEIACLASDWKCR